MAYPAIGGGVNLAARLEGLNKHYGSTILISESVYHKVHSQVQCRILDCVAVKGKSVPCHIFEALGLKSEGDLLIDQELRDSYGQCLALLMSGVRNVLPAYNHLAELVKKFPHDRPSRLLYESTAEFLKDPTSYSPYFSPDFKCPVGIYL
mmetsp:Transcript_1392/g.2110  ORF Transcript_1392/g.2110 Transcript_1392/m.2110 type:complete len:150 (+) Transcript_1392:69-518(+)